MPVNILYTPEDIARLDYLRDLGFPGEYPYHPRRALEHVPGPALDHARVLRVRHLPRTPTAATSSCSSHGETGLSVAFDFPTLYGCDSDDALSQGEVGKCGVAISSLADMETLFDGIPLDKVSTSMTINGPAAVIWAFYIAAAEKQGVGPEKLRGTIQNDILKEYIAQKSWLFPPEPSMRLITDIMAFAAEARPAVEHDLDQRLPHPRSRLDRAAGTGVHARGRPHLRRGRDQGRAGRGRVRAAALVLLQLPSRLLRGDRQVPRRAPHLGPGDEGDVQGEEAGVAGCCRFHTQTAGCTLTAQQPENNIVRTAFQALAAVLGGTQSLHTNSMDETWALPTEKAVLIALRTQQMIAEETGVTNVIDPLGGSYFVEALTNQMEEGATTTSGRSTRWAEWSRPSSTASPSARLPTRPTGTRRRSRRRSGSWSA